MYITWLEIIVFLHVLSFLKSRKRRMENEEGCEPGDEEGKSIKRRIFRWIFGSWGCYDLRPIEGWEEKDEEETIRRPGMTSRLLHRSQDSYEDLF